MFSPQRSVVTTRISERMSERELIPWHHHAAFLMLPELKTANCIPVVMRPGWSESHADRETERKRERESGRERKQRGRGRKETAGTHLSVKYTPQPLRAVGQTKWFSQGSVTQGLWKHVTRRREREQSKTAQSARWTRIQKAGELCFLTLEYLLPFTPVSRSGFEKWTSAHRQTRHRFLSLYQTHLTGALKAKK